MPYRAPWPVPGAGARSRPVPSSEPPRPPARRRALQLPEHLHLPLATLLLLGLTASASAADGTTPDAGIAAPSAPSPARVERVREAVVWLAADERDGRGIGTEGLAEAEAWLADQMAEIGVEPGGDDGGWFHAFDVPTDVVVEEGAALTLDDSTLGAEDWRPAPFSASGSLEAEVVAVGYGISAEDLSHDDYAEVDVTGKVVAVRRFVPPGARFAEERNQ
ncbi:MAG: hypothetical protein MI919_05395, partial [Holophagales bacterium]|nr:hypothetical protein [Holophagales bacterium]